MSRRCGYCIGGQVLIAHHASFGDEPGSDETEDCEACCGTGLDTSDPLLGADDGPAAEVDAVPERDVDRIVEVFALAAQLGGGEQATIDASRVVRERAA